jgi:hypothetical protein
MEMKLREAGLLGFETPVNRSLCLVGQTYSLNNSFLELDTTITTEQMGEKKVPSYPIGVESAIELYDDLLAIAKRRDSNQGDGPILRNVSGITGFTLGRTKGLPRTCIPKVSSSTVPQPLFPNSNSNP